MQCVTAQSALDTLDDDMHNSTIIHDSTIIIIIPVIVTIIIIIITDICIALISIGAHGHPVLNRMLKI